MAKKSEKKKQNKIKKSISGSMMQQFIEEGKYPLLKQTEGKVDIITSSIRKELEQSETKRHEFTKYNLVGRFTAKKIYEVDTVSLNEYLYDLGLLLQVAEIDHKKIKTNELYLDMIEPFKLEKSFYLKPNFNKAGKSLFQLPGAFEREVNENWKMDDKASSLAILKPMLKGLKQEFEALKRKMLSTEEIQKLMLKKTKESIPHQYGSLSLLAHPAKYDISAIYDYIGEWILIDYGTPNAERLEYFILNGTISKKEIDQFKMIKDIRLDFSVMSLEDERKILEMLDRKNQIAASNRLGA